MSGGCLVQTMLDLRDLLEDRRQQNIQLKELLPKYLDAIAEEMTAVEPRLANPAKRSRWGGKVSVKIEALVPPVPPLPTEELEQFQQEQQRNMVQMGTAIERMQLKADIVRVMEALEPCTGSGAADTNGPPQQSTSPQLGGQCGTLEGMLTAAGALITVSEQCAGIKLRASQHCQKGTVLFRPAAADLISAADSEHDCPELRQLLLNAQLPEDNRSRLVLKVLYYLKYHLQRQPEASCKSSAPADPIVWPYWQQLPVLWSDRDLSMLRGSTTLQKLQAKAAQLQVSYEQYNGACTYDEYATAQMLVEQQAVEVEGQLMLCPALRLVEHHADSNAELRYTAEAVGCCCQLVAKVPILEGEEVCISVYDPHEGFATRFERYGVLDETGSQHNVQISVSMQQLGVDESVEPWRLDLLTVMLKQPISVSVGLRDLYTEMIMCPELACRDDCPLLAVVRAANITELEWNGEQSLLKPVTKEADVLNTMYGLVWGWLRQYPMLVWSGRRSLICAQVISYEKAALESVLADLGALSAELTISNEEMGRRSKNGRHASSGTSKPKLHINHSPRSHWS